MLFNNKKSLPISSNSNIEINYFNTTEAAKSYLDALDETKWEILRFTPSQYYKEHHEKYSEASCKTSHQVIGQEFDGVAVTIDRFFSMTRKAILFTKMSVLRPTQDAIPKHHKNQKEIEPSNHRQ